MTDEVVWPWGMTERDPDPASRPWVFGPRGFLLTVLEDAEKAEQAVAALEDAGFPPEHLRTYTGGQVLEEPGAVRRPAGRGPAPGGDGDDRYGGARAPPRLCRRGAGVPVGPGAERDDANRAIRGLSTFDVLYFRYYGDAGWRTSASPDLADIVRCHFGDREDTLAASFRGAIFDVDGVLVDSPHEKAWRESLRELMESDWADVRDRTTWSPEAFTAQVYQQEMSGKPRMSGARAALDHFNVPEPEVRVTEYADRKQAMVIRLIEAGDFTAYPDALRFIIAVKDAGMRVAAASSSKNAGLFLRKIRLDTFAEEHGIDSASVRPGTTLLEFFDADVSGRDFAHGKPHPEMFLTAAEQLGVEPQASFVMEDATAGVEAARAGDMAAIGVARFDDAELLAAAGADIVVASLDEVDVAAIAQGKLVKRGG